MTKQTRYFVAGSTAVLGTGLAIGLMAYATGGFQPVSAAAGSTELRYVPADATVVAYADVRAIMDSDLRARLKEVIPSESEGRKDFQEKTGIDIERDIDYIVASFAPDTKAGSPLIVARGRFNAGLLETLAREHGGQVEHYKETMMIVGSDDATHAEGGTHVTVKRPALAFLEPGLVAIGDAAAIRKAIDAQQSALSITSNDELMAIVAGMNRDIGTANAWAVGRFDILASQADLPAEVTSRLPPVKWFGAAGHINGGVSGMLRAEARDEKSAQDLRAVVNGFLALVRLQAEADPRAAAMANSLMLSGTGTTVSLQFTVPSEVLDLIPQVAQTR